MSVPSLTHRFSDLPLAFRIAVLSVGLSAALALGLTWLGYTRARDGLSEQAQATIAADARGVAQAVDAWHANRIDVLKAVAQAPTAQRILTTESASQDDLKDAAALLTGIDRGVDAVDSITITSRQAKAVVDSDPKGVGNDVSARDYFQAPMAGQPTFISSVTVSTITNKPTLFHSVMVAGPDGKPAGIVRSRATLDDVQRLVAGAQGRAGAGAHGILLDENGLVIASTVDAGWQGRPVVDLSTDVATKLDAQKRWGNAARPPALGEHDLAAAIGVREPRTLTWTTGGVEYHALAVPLASTRWTYVTALPVATFEAPATAFLWAAIVAAVVGLLLSCLVTVLFARQISHKLGAISKVARSLARGDVEQRIDITGKDELGQMAEAFRATIAYQREASAVARTVAGGDLTCTIEPKSERDVLGQSLSDMIRSLRSVLHQVQGSTDRVAANSRYLSDSSTHAGEAVQQVATAMQQLARDSDSTACASEGARQVVHELRESIDAVASGAREQGHTASDTTRTIQSVAAEIDRMAADAQTIAEAGRRAQTTAETSAEALRDTVAGMTEIAQVVEAASERVRELGTLGERIGGVVETIDDVAAQTNLLALNAAIEAARAGEHGRGFAIVADEVRKLAERSQRETRAIGELIQGVQSGTQQAVEAMAAGSSSVKRGVTRADQAGHALAAILDAVRTTVGQVGQVAESAERAATGARAAVDRMRAMIGLVEQSASAAEAMAGFSAEVDGSVGTIADSAAGATAVAEEVSAAAEQMSAQVEEMTAQAEDLAMTADALRDLVGQFNLGDEDEDETAALPGSPAVDTTPTPISRASRERGRQAIG
jgi:methyl-accepting chemotaxis protein